VSVRTLGKRSENLNALSPIEKTQFELEQEASAIRARCCLPWSGNSPELRGQQQLRNA
jgi:hypothetical protein